MASKKLKRLGFSPVIRDRLQRQHILTCRDLLSLTELQLVKILGLGINTVRQIVLKTSRACAPTSSTLLEMMKEARGPAYLRTSLTQVDRILHGGLPTGTITEIAGPAGCGKTQMSIMLSILTTLPINRGGLGGAVLYIDTESAFSAQRLVEMAAARFPDDFATDESLTELTSRIHVSLETTCATLLKRLENLEEDIIRKKVKLIVIDSMASLVRKEFDSKSGRNLVERTQLLSRQAALLKYISETFTIPVVVTNQITTRYGSSKPDTQPNLAEDNDDESVGLSEGEPGYVTAALGNTWSHSVNTRLILQYLDGPRRQLLVAKSPIAPFAQFTYTIDASGLVLEEGGADTYDGTDPGLQHIRVRSAIPQDAFVY